MDGPVVAAVGSVTAARVAAINTIGSMVPVASMPSTALSVAAFWALSTASAASLPALALAGAASALPLLAALALAPVAVLLLRRATGWAGSALAAVCISALSVWVVSFVGSPDA